MLKFNELGSFFTSTPFLQSVILSIAVGVWTFAE